MFFIITEYGKKVKVFHRARVFGGPPEKNRLFSPLRRSFSTDF
jgi:hypothetical protein